MTGGVITVIERAKVDAINREHRLVEQASQSALDHAAECGRMLSAVKADLQHGDWLPWLRDHFAASEDTAQLYMQIAANPERVRYFTSIRDAKKQLARPRAASPRDAIGMVGGLEDDEPARDPDGAASVSRERLDDARARLQASTGGVWTDQHSRRRQRIVDMLDEAHRALDHASDQGLGAHAIAEMLRTGEIKARQASAQLGELAFSFER